MCHNNLCCHRLRSIRCNVNPFVSNPIFLLTVAQVHPPRQPGSSKPSPGTPPREALSTPARPGRGPPTPKAPLAIRRTLGLRFLPSSVSRALRKGNVYFFNSYYLESRQYMLHFFFQVTFCKY